MCAVQLLQASCGKTQIRVPCCSSWGWGARSLNLGCRSRVTGDARLKGRSSPDKVKLPLRLERKILMQNVQVCLFGQLQALSQLSFHLVPIPLVSAVILLCAGTVSGLPILLFLLLFETQHSLPAERQMLVSLSGFWVFAKSQDLKIKQRHKYCSVFTNTELSCSSVSSLSLFTSSPHHLLLT